MADSDETDSPQQVSNALVSTNAKPSHKAAAKQTQAVSNTESLSPIAAKEMFPREYVSELRGESQSWK